MRLPHGHQSASVPGRRLRPDPHNHVRGAGNVSWTCACCGAVVSSLAAATEHIVASRHADGRTCGPDAPTIEFDSLAC